MYEYMYLHTLYTLFMYTLLYIDRFMFLYNIYLILYNPASVFIHIYINLDIYEGFLCLLKQPRNHRAFLDDMEYTCDKTAAHCWAMGGAWCTFEVTENMWLQSPSRHWALSHGTKGTGKPVMWWQKGRNLLVQQARWL